MELIGEVVLGRSPEEAWAALVDVGILRHCIPGCTSLEQTDENSYLGKMAVKVGPVTATFGGTVVMSGMEYPRSCTLEGRGQGGAAGFVKGSAVITLTAVAAGSQLNYSADVQIGGKLASVGNRLFGSVARKNIDQFFTRFRELDNAFLDGCEAAMPPH